jgi:thioredoxin-related protein
MAGTVARLPAVRRSGFPLDGRRKWHHVFRTMKTIRLLTTLCAALVATPAGLLAAEAPWTADFAAAKKEAAASDKDLLIDFTGSDWCGWCIKLTKEVFSHDEFKEGVKDKFVLVELDFPQDKSKLPEETQKQNEKLGAEYAVQGYPTILLTDAEGRPYAATGYQKGGPEAYLKHLDELRENKKKRDEALAAAEKAEGVEKAKSLVAALDAMDLSDELVAKHYGEVVDKIKAADPKDETGFAKKLEAKEREEEFQGKLQEFAQSGDWDGAIKLVDEKIKSEDLDKEEKQRLMMTRAMIFAQQGNFDGALKATDEAIAFAPDSPMNDGIKGFRKQLEEAKNNAAKGGDEEKEDAEPAGEE